MQEPISFNELIRNKIDFYCKLFYLEISYLIYSLLCCFDIFLQSAHFDWFQHEWEEHLLEASCSVAGKKTRPVTTSFMDCAKLLILKPEDAPS